MYEKEHCVSPPPSSPLLGLLNAKVGIFRAQISLKVNDISKFKDREKPQDPKKRLFKMKINNERYNWCKSLWL